jgi:hypothetical protein
MGARRPPRPVPAGAAARAGRESGARDRARRRRPRAGVRGRRVQVRAGGRSTGPALGPAPGVGGIGLAPSPQRRTAQASSPCIAADPGAHGDRSAAARATGCGYCMARRTRACVSDAHERSRRAALCEHDRTRPTSVRSDAVRRAGRRYPTCFASRSIPQRPGDGARRTRSGRAPPRVRASDQRRASASPGVASSSGGIVRSPASASARVRASRQAPASASA